MGHPLASFRDVEKHFYSPYVRHLTSIYFCKVANTWFCFAPFKVKKKLCEIGLQRNQWREKEGEVSELFCCDNCQCKWINIVAAFKGMHVSPAKHSYAWLPRKCDYRTDGQTDAGQSDPYVPLCFAGDTKTNRHILLCSLLKNMWCVTCVIQYR